MTDRGYPPFEDRMSQSRGRGLRACRSSFWGGPVLEELSGGNWMVAGRAPLRGGAVNVPGRTGLLNRPRSRAGVSSLSLLGYTTASVPPFRGGDQGRATGWGFRVLSLPGITTVVTWLILPVGICLSQRLSHACLSISNYTVKLRMAH